ncbi:helix-turn-helix domain-containing protein, partial [Paracidovorax citrulli]
MQSPDELISLIDQASAKAGSDYKLAKLISQPPQRISDWRHGRTTCSPEDQALMAAVAGMDALATLARATVAKHEGKAKGDLLMKALGKALLVTGAAVGSAGASAAAIFGSMPAPTHLGEWVL